MREILLLHRKAVQYIPCYLVTHLYYIGTHIWTCNAIESIDNIRNKSNKLCSQITLKRSGVLWPERRWKECNIQIQRIPHASSIAWKRAYAFRMPAISVLRTRDANSAYRYKFGHVCNFVACYEKMPTGPFSNFHLWTHAMEAQLRCSWAWTSAFLKHPAGFAGGSWDLMGMSSFDSLWLCFAARNWVLHVWEQAASCCSPALRSLSIDWESLGWECLELQGTPLKTARICMRLLSLVGVACQFSICCWMQSNLQRWPTFLLITQRQMDSTLDG